MGEMLKEIPKAKGSEYGGKQKVIDGNMMLPTMNTPTLKDIGIEKNQSSRWQKIADLPEKTFENTIQEIKQAKEELTEAFMLKQKKIIDREIEIQKQKEYIESGKIKLPEGKFDVIVIDPPWAYDRGRKTYDPKGHRVTNPYPEIEMSELLKLKLPSKKDCILWLWTTNAFMKEAYELLEEWEFIPKTILTWNKVNIGVGHWLRNVTEHCILAIKGSPVWDNKTYSTLITEKRTTHSTKPKSFYEMVDKICYGRKLDYFARKKREGWDVYGDEIKDNDSIPTKKVDEEGNVR